MKFINPKARAVAHEKSEDATEGLRFYKFPTFCLYNCFRLLTSSTDVSAVGSEKVAGFLAIILVPWQLCILT